MDRYRDRRSPDRSGRYAPPSDSYHPSASRASRPRSRSPLTHRPRSRSPNRTQNESWRGGRDRSPLRRPDNRSDGYSRDSRPRSPRKDYAPADSRYDDGGRGVRGRASPPPVKRGLSPNGRGERSPPPAKRERVLSPGRDYGRTRSPSHRTYSPPRDSRPSYRARSRSPRRDRSPLRDSTAREPYNGARRSPSSRAYNADVSEADGGRNSVGPSRRSDETNGYVNPDYVPQWDGRVTKFVSSPPFAISTNRSAHHMLTISGSPRPPLDFSAPSAPASSRYGQSTPPIGPAGTPGSSQSRADSFSAPSHPRGGYGGYRGRGGPPHRDYSRDHGPSAGGPPRNPSYGSSSPFYGRGGQPPRDPYASRDYQDSRGPPPPRHRDYGGPPGFRGSSNTTSTTYPRTQRFNQQLADLPKAKPGGEKSPPLYDTTKADKLDEEAARLRKAIDEKEAQKRKGLREWDRLQREGEVASLRTELAEEHVKILDGEAEEGGAAF